MELVLKILLVILLAGLLGIILHQMVPIYQAIGRGITNIFKALWSIVKFVTSLFIVIAGFIVLLIMPLFLGVYLVGVQAICRFGPLGLIMYIAFLIFLPFITLPVAYFWGMKASRHVRSGAALSDYDPYL